MCRLCYTISSKTIDKAAHKARCKNRTTCKYCNKTMTQLERNIYKFACHVEKCGGENIFICQLCNFITTNEKEHRNHARVCKKGERQCITCNQVFSTPKGLAEHVSIVHPAIVCDICKCVFMTYEQLKQHAVKSHSTIGK